MRPPKTMQKAVEAYNKCHPCRSRDYFVDAIENYVEALRHSDRLPEIYALLDDRAMDTRDRIFWDIQAYSKGLYNAADALEAAQFQSLDLDCRHHIMRPYYQASDVYKIEDVHAVVGVEISNVFEYQVPGVVAIVQEYLCCDPNGAHTGCQQTLGGQFARRMALAFYTRCVGFMEAKLRSLKQLDTLNEPRVQKDDERRMILRQVEAVVSQNRTMDVKKINDSAARLRWALTHYGEALVDHNKCKHEGAITRSLLERMKTRVVAAIAEENRLQELGFDTVVEW